MNVKTKINLARLKIAVKKVVTVIFIFITGLSCAVNYYEGVEMYQFIKEGNKAREEAQKLLNQITTDSAIRDQKVSPVVTPGTIEKSEGELSDNKKALESTEGESVASPSPSSLIEQYFPEEKAVAIAVAKAESGLKADAMGWNCYYGDTSTSCKPEDRGKAWSVDCGIMQINVIGKDCPEELFDISTNLKEARAKYDKRKWQPWYAFKSGAYLAHM